MTGKIHSFQSLGTVDGPGVRAVVFMQGCPLRCSCCHNPDTWDPEGGKSVTVEELTEKIRRLRPYFGREGGLTVSGGEPLMQTGFVKELFRACKSEGISCALDTSGCVYNAEVEELLSLCNVVLLDYKYTNDEDYRAHVGCSLNTVERFLSRLDEMKKRTWLRYVVIPDLNDGESSLLKLRGVKEKYPCVEKIELLPFRKLCIEKYHMMNIPFPLSDTPEADKKEVERMQELVNGQSNE